MKRSTTWNGTVPLGIPSQLADIPSRTHVHMPRIVRNTTVWWRGEDREALIWQKSCYIVKHGYRFFWEQGSTHIPLEKHRDRFFLLGHGRL